MDPLNGKGTLTQSWGANPQFPWQLGYGHLGCDWAAGIGTPIVSIAPGVVLFADWGQNMSAGLANECMFIPGSPNNGICVVIQHDGWRQILCHMDSTHLNAGNRVVRGQEVGKLGTTGNSTGPHVHGETWDRVPASNVPKFSRYNILDQIRLEDSTAGAGTPATPAAPPARPRDQRQVGRTAVEGRLYPFQGGPKIGRAAPAGGWEVFTRWTHGENVILGTYQSDVWYGDNQGWYWAGGFETQDGNGLWEISRADAFPADYRLSGPMVGKVRGGPTSRAGIVREIPPYSVERFTKWTAGENVNLGGVESNIWYGDDTGWTWAGWFTEQSGRGLTEVRPEPVLAPNQRKVGSSGGNRRATPKAGGQVVGQVKADDTEVFSHWTKGDPVTVGTVTSDLWYKDSLGYAWAGLFTEQKKDGLPEFVFVEGTTPPATGAYTFTKAFDIITEVHPAAAGNFEPGNFPAAKDVDAIFFHQFNADEPADNPVTNKNTVHLDSVIATFTGTGRVASADFGVEKGRRAQFVKVAATGGDRAYAQGADWNGRAWSIETFGGQDPETMESAAQVAYRLEKLAGKRLEFKRHNDPGVMATKCGNGIDITWYRNRVNQLHAAENPPAPPADPKTVAGADELFKKIQDLIGSWFNRK